MAVDMSKNGAELKAAYEDVLDGRSDIDWVLFTYEGNGNTMRLAAKGDGGLQEMLEELNSGKVMYAFCRVREPNSGLPKYVLINWTGEGVKEARKGLCANHLGTVANFLKGAHVTINARDEDDVDPDVILSKVSKASGANYNFSKASQSAGDFPRGAVGSVYCKTNAVDEMEQINKDSFWSQAQREEEARRQEEVKKAQLQRQAVEQERRDLEDKLAREREIKTQQRNMAIDHNRLQQKQRQEEEREKEQQQRKLQTPDEETKRASSARAGSARAANEAEALISQRSFNPRDVFKQRETAVAPAYGGSALKTGKLQSPFLHQLASDSPQAPPGHRAFQPSEPASVSPPESPSARNPFQPVHLPASPQSDPFWPRPDTSDDFLGRPGVVAAVASSPGGAAVAARAAAEDDDWSDEFDDDLYEAAPGGQQLRSLADAMFPTDARDDEYAVPLPVGGDASTGRDATDAGMNVCARAVYDYQAADDTEITFDPDDIITGIEMVDEGWWRGFGPDGRFGMFPANYVELV
ncbi:drebrin-like protein B isoform X2 [Syngnathus scovelli]|uniref:drebrin-like protein B isoform X2 n=1 Tax=Syngnathus scovelli TaxID=161590 RepID=UPI00210FF984|nr:drebrin-like protein B isoform X2 [Syngnathus scovelli]